jgi:antitoxin ParD1/3/4
LTILGQRKYSKYMHVNLTPHLDRFVLHKVKSGRYNNASEVVREALRKLEDDDLARHSTLEDPDDAAELVRQGLEDLKRGDYVDINGDDELRAYFAKARERARAELMVEKKARK